MNQGHPVSIAAFMAAGVPLRPHEAVAIVLELCRQVGRRRAATGVMPAISAGTVTLDGAGVVTVAGGVPGEDEQTVSLVGRLLVEMLDHSAAAVENAVPPRLRATAFRAASSGREAFASLADFVSALRRHGPEFEPTQAIVGVFDRWAEGRTSPTPVTRADPQAANFSDRRKNGPSPDVLRRFLREAEQEAYLARVAAPPPLPAARRPYVRAARALLVGVLLLVLAAAGFVFLVAGTVDDLPLVAPVARPTPVAPRVEPGWELLRRPVRASLGPESGSDRHRAQTGSRRVLTSTPPPDVAAAPGRQQ